MGVQPPYLYDAIKTEGPLSPYKEFDPKAVTRASQTPNTPRKRQEGPLVSFNQHPDSYLILPLQNTSGKYMNPSVKSWVKWTRILQLALRCLQVLCAGGLLAFMIILRGMDTATGWILRIAPGVALLHTMYGIYHLSRKASGRTPASSAGYMLFASFFDVSILPFYAFTAMLGYNHQINAGSWTVILSDQTLTLTFSKIVFLLAAIGGGLHLISLANGLYLAVTFRKINNLPPDMNPLEPTLTSRHKKAKSSVSTFSTSTSLAEKRLSAPLESKRSSGAAYEDLSRPPTIPFFHTRSNSTDSFSTYRTTPSTPRDSRVDLPSRQYQIMRNSNGSSIILDPHPSLKRQSQGPSTLPKRASRYQDIPVQTSPAKIGNMAQGWYASDSLFKTRTRPNSPQKGTYQPVALRYDDQGTDLSTPPRNNRHRRYDSDVSNHANPLESNPPTPRKHCFSTHSGSPLSEVSKISSNNTSGDIADVSNERSPYYSPERYDSDRENECKDSFKSKYYGDLKPATPPIVVGAGGNRQVSSGNDFLNQKGRFGSRIRDASGKIAEEGLHGVGGRGWGLGRRKVSEVN